MKKNTGLCCRIMLFAGALLLSGALMQQAMGQDQNDQNDPPSRVARLGYMQGSVSFQPAGESQWVEAVPNRPMTTGDQLWADRDSRAELNLGSAVIDLNSNTGVSFLNLDDRTAQVQLSAGSINVRVRRLNRDDVFEIDTPNQAFSIYQPGRYRVEVSEDGTYTVVSIREGEGESTGNGETYTVHAGQRA
ncbi:MAG TPA: FecR domain-containing protein, partial [Candidatus Sulfotelmatobacter sp.]|nr:FecR domain-containing protein [Candidatus Sulfotelmatobacter sp.]